MFSDKKEPVYRVLVYEQKAKQNGGYNIWLDVAVKIDKNVVPL